MMMKEKKKTTTVVIMGVFQFMPRKERGMIRTRTMMMVTWENMPGKYYH